MRNLNKKKQTRLRACIKFPENDHKGQGHALFFDEKQKGQRHVLFFYKTAKEAKNIHDLFLNKNAKAIHHCLKKKLRTCIAF